MALFQKKLDSSDGSSLYTVGMSKNILIIGLGNPGKKYDGTRHNIGFEILDNFAKKNNFQGWIAKKDLKCEITTSNMGSTRVILCKPSTFMNASGEAAQAVQRYYRVYNSETLVIYDELAIPFGSLRTRVGGSDGGHNGVKSLIEHLGDDFNRLRIGTGNEISKKADASDFVLGKFTKNEQEVVPLISREAAAVITEFIFGGKLPHETRTIT
jgi:PTH1 family peptidyl-tRNA hydrolase